MNHGRVNVRFVVQGPLSTEVINNAWLETVKHHPALRASIKANKQGNPILIIRNEEGITNHSPICCPTTPSRNEISLSDSPSSVLYVNQNHEKNTKFDWYCHHAFLDGWSAQIILSDFVLACNSFISNGNGPWSRSDHLMSTERYLRIHRQLSAEYKPEIHNYWTKVLANYHSPALLTHAASGAMKHTNQILLHDLCSTDLSSQLQTLCRQTGVTTAAVYQFIWGLALSTLCKQSDVVIGQVTSGRPPTIDGISSVTGSFANVCASRVNLTNSSQTVAQLLLDIQQQHFSGSEFQHTSLTHILDCAEPACRAGLFDSLLLIQNHISNVDTNQNMIVTLESYQSDIVSRFPLTVSIIPNECHTLRLDYDPDKLTYDWIHSLAYGIANALELVIRQWNLPLSNLVRTANTLFPEHPDPRALNLRNSQDITRSELLISAVGPKTEKEQSMLALWEQQLQIRPIDMSHNFFDIGGTSLLALRLLHAIENEFGQRLPAALFFQNPSPKDCITALEKLSKNSGQLDNRAIRSIIALKKEGQQPALFCLHAGGGHALFYRDFSQLLPNNTPCYALQPKGIDGDQLPLNNLTEMAQFYIEEIRSVQPDGPYHFLCYCFGGALIMEMANILDKEGAAVGHLIVADAPSPIPAKHPMGKLGWNAYLIYEFLAQKRWDYLGRLAKVIIKRILFRLNRTSTPNVNSENHIAAVHSACVTAFKQYRACTTNFHFHFLNAENNDRGTSSEVYMRNWATLTPNHSSIELSGNHRTIFDQPYVTKTAAAVVEILDSQSANLQRSNKS